MTNHDLGAHQIGSILFFLARFSFSLFGYQLLFKTTGNNTIYAFLIAAFFSLLLFFILLKIRKKKNIILKFSKKQTQLFFLIFFVVLFLFMSGSFIQWIQKTMIDLPYLLLLFLIVFLIRLFTREGLNSLSKISILLFGLYLFFFFLHLGGGITLINLDFLTPHLTVAVSNFLKSIGLSFLLLSFPLWFLLFLPHNQLNPQKKQEKTLFSYFLFGCLSVFLELLLMNLTLGSQLMIYYPYPLFALTSRISSFLLLNRILFLFSFYQCFDTTIVLGLIGNGIKVLWNSFKK